MKHVQKAHNGYYRRKPFLLKENKRDSDFEMISSGGREEEKAGV
jgi:hypothetical protein